MIEFIKDIRFRKNMETYMNSNSNNKNFHSNNNNNNVEAKRLRKKEIKELTMRLKFNKKKVLILLI